MRATLQNRLLKLLYKTRPGRSVDTVAREMRAPLREVRAAAEALVQEGHAEWRQTRQVQASLCITPRGAGELLFTRITTPHLAALRMVEMWQPCTKAFLMSRKIAFTAHHERFTELFSVGALVEHDGLVTIPARTEWQGTSYPKLHR